MGRKSASGSGIRDEQPGSYFLELRNHFFGFFGVKILKFFYEDPGWRQFGSGIRDGKKSDPGSGINIPDPQHWIIYAYSGRVSDPDPYVFGPPGSGSFYQANIVRKTLIPTFW